MTAHHFDPSKERNKNRQLILDYIRKTVESGSGLSIAEMKKEYAEDAFFFHSLKHVTTTKKSLCEALHIPVEAACRYKRTFELAELLWEVNYVYCPFTKHLAWTLSTDPAQAPPKRGTQPGDSSQLSLFDL